VHRRSLTALVAAALIPLSLGVVGCSDDENKPRTVEPDEVYVSIIRWELGRISEQADDAPPGSGPNSTDQSDKKKLPVVYVAAADGSEISAKVQAKVAAETVDDAMVRFADSPDDVVDRGSDDEPVNDDGVLLSIERIESDASLRRETDVVIYRSQTDQQTWTLTVDASGDGATITSSTLQPS
jgi:hypothetical protein